ncbi:hypothetical protein I7I48_10242 [Histoplasma ohiense]|nr:hypothetical protein I7I48_10242 [Histoplasma ohiense (nom. inval.)]
MTSICSIHCTRAITESEATNIMEENHETHTSATESVQQASPFSMKLNSEHSSEEDTSSEDLCDGLAPVSNQLTQPTPLLHPLVPGRCDLA